LKHGGCCLWKGLGRRVHGVEICVHGIHDYFSHEDRQRIKVIEPIAALFIDAEATSTLSFSLKTPMKKQLLGILP
jgi:hypothetical protein